MKKNFLLWVIVSLLLLPVTADARKHRSRKLNIDPAAIDRLSPSDMIVEGVDSLVAFSGYDKPLNSNYETFFASNNNDRRLLKLWVTLNYMTTDGRQFHARSEEIRTNIPSGESRQLTLRSFDRQHSFYYHRSRKPRSNDGIAPFKVTIAIDSAAFEKISR